MRVFRMSLGSLRVKEDGKPERYAHPDAIAMRELCLGALGLIMELKESAELVYELDEEDLEIIEKLKGLE